MSATLHIGRRSEDHASEHSCRQEQRQLLDQSSLSPRSSNFLTLILSVSESDRSSVILSGLRRFIYYENDPECTRITNASPAGN